MAEIKKRWYVLRVIGGKEKKVKEYIENEVASLGLQGLCFTGFDTYRENLSGT